MNIDEWFKKVREKFPGQIQCGKGCTACCHGLFDISLADAIDVAKGYQGLPADQQNQISTSAADIHRVIREASSSACAPTLFDEDDERIDQIVEAANNAPCPFLG